MQWFKNSHHYCDLQCWLLAEVEKDFQKDYKLKLSAISLNQESTKFIL